MSMVAPSNLFYIVNDKFRVIVRLIPKASQNSIVSLAHETDGSVVIKTSVTATPEASKANTALLKLLATEWKLPKSSLSIIKGATTQKKLLRLRKTGK
jgi:uncharacterized protein YggU (UPF0235/DUF167 family)